MDLDAVEVPDDFRLGCFANAFRVEDVDGECILDFLVYSERESKAQVVSRVRVPRLLASYMRARLAEIFPGSRVE